MKKKNILHMALESVGWLIFAIVYSLGIAATLMIVDSCWSIPDVWKAWETGEKWLYSLLWGLALLVYTLIMLVMVLVFKVLSAFIYSKLMKAKIWAERKTHDYIQEIVKIRMESMPNPPPVPQGEI